ncbi:hypothetical protein [Streptomyces sp. NPDC054952]
MTSDDQERQDKADAAAKAYAEALKSSLFAPARKWGCSQRMLAGVVGVNQGTVSRYLTGSGVAPRAFVDSLVAYLASKGVEVTEQQLETVHALRRAAQKLRNANQADVLNDRIAALGMDLKRIRDQRDALADSGQQQADALAELNAQLEKLSLQLGAAMEENNALKEQLKAVTARLEEKESGREALAELVLRQRGQLVHAAESTRDLEAELTSARATVEAMERELTVLRRQVDRLMEETRPAGAAQPADADDATQAGAGEPQYTAPVPSPTVSSDAADATQADPGESPYDWADPSPPLFSDAADATQEQAGQHHRTSPAPPAGEQAAARRSGGPQYSPPRPQGPWGPWRGSTAEPTSSGAIGMPVAPPTGNTASAPRRRKPTPPFRAPAAGLGTQRRHKIGQTGAILLCVGFLTWWLGDTTVGDLLPWTDRPAATSTKAKPSPTPSPSAVPSRDPLDIGNVAVDTPEVRALPTCTDTSVLIQAFAPSDVRTGNDVRIEILLNPYLVHEPCRVDISRHALTLTITNTAGDIVWSSAHCTPPPPTQRWAQLHYEYFEATVAWDQHTNSPTCPTATRPVPPGVYIAQAFSTQTAEPSEPVSFVIR